MTLYDQMTLGKEEINTRNRRLFKPTGLYPFSKLFNYIIVVNYLPILLEETGPLAAISYDCSFGILSVN